MRAWNSPLQHPEDAAELVLDRARHAGEPVGLDLAERDDALSVEHAVGEVNCLMSRPSGNETVRPSEKSANGMPRRSATSTSPDRRAAAPACRSRVSLRR